MQDFLRPVSQHRRRTQRGSALLIVFVFAAVLAIMLYRELPVVLFEAKRQKEELLVDRGHEYVRAVQLFYRRNRGQYPSSIEQLENTNGVRFLRHRYKDPFTGKDDWRLLHAGPGGMLIDSKVQRAQLPGMPLSQTGLQQQQQNSNSSTTTPPTDAEVVVPDVPQRPPAVEAGSGGAASPSPDGSTTPASSDLAQNPATPLLPTAGGPAQQTSSATTSQPANPVSAIQSQLQSVSPLSPQSLSGQGTAGSPSAFGNSTMGQINSGGIAGVASKAAGHTIKSVEDQRDYSKWEFWYDPTKDKRLGSNLAGGNIGPQQNQNQNQNPTQNQPQQPPPADQNQPQTSQPGPNIPPGLPVSDQPAIPQ